MADFARVAGKAQSAEGIPAMRKEVHADDIELGRPLKSALPLAELAFAIYFSYFVVYAIMHRQFFSVPFLLMFQAGFLYVCLSSFVSRWSKLNFGSSQSRATIPA